MQYTLNNLLSVSLEQVERMWINGIISQDLYDQYYHLWRSNRSLMEYHDPCKCKICTMLKAHAV